MTIETTPTLSIQLSETLQTLRSDLETVQREVDQALSVWRVTLIAEKKESQGIWQEKEKSWTALESDWQNQKSVYDAKIQELEVFYKSQMATFEQNALQALNELDDSWQRDKLVWNQGASQQLRDVEAREAALATQIQKHLSNETHLEARLNELAETIEQKALESSDQAAAWQRERDGYETKFRIFEESAQAVDGRRAQQLSDALTAQEAKWADEKLLWQMERDASDIRFRALEESSRKTELQRAQHYADEMSSLQAKTAEDRSQRQAERDVFDSKLQQLEASLATARDERIQAHTDEVQALKDTWELEKSVWLKERETFQNTIHNMESYAQSAESQRMQQQIEALEAMKANWHKDKLRWQETSQETQYKFSVTEKAWSDEGQKQNRVIQQLEERLAEVQSELQTASLQTWTSDTLIRTHLEALDNQMALLQEVFSQVAIPLHPLRRKTDSPWVERRTPSPSGI